MEVPQEGKMSPFDPNFMEDIVQRICGYIRVKCIYQLSDTEIQDTITLPPSICIAVQTVTLICLPTHTF